MKYIFLLIFFSFFSCYEGKEQRIIKKDKEIKKKVEEVEIDSSLIGMDSIIVKDQKFYIKCLDSDYWKDKINPDCNLIIQDKKGDTIYKNEILANCFELKDFDEDGYVDIEINYITNVPGIYDMLLYDVETKNFRKVSNFDNFPSSTKIKGVDLYYSYHRSGCADLDWDSDLFYIKDYKCYRIGNISGRGCEDNERKGIVISKIINDKAIEIDWMKRKAGFYDDKWDFIEKYWTKNYKKFIK